MVTLLSVVVPAYREADTIAEALRGLLSVLDGLDRPYEVIVVSDGNTDGTEEIARQLELPNVRVLHYDQNQGKGYALPGFIQPSLRFLSMRVNAGRIWNEDRSFCIQDF